MRVSYFGDAGTQQYPLNLHWVWDTSIIEHQLRIKEQSPNQPNLEARRAAALAANDIDRHFAQGLPEQSAADPAIWAMESHDAARETVYPGVVAPGAQPPASPVSLGEPYQKRAWPVVERRLALGGLRLAELLNKVLGA